MDTHRSIALVASPFTKRGGVDSTLYDTAAMLRTIELILGLPPMSNLDAGATPMYAAFQSTPVLTPFKARPARIDIQEKNAANAWGAEASARDVPGRGGPGARAGAERDHLEVGEGEGQRDAAAGRAPHSCGR